MLFRYHSDTRNLFFGRMFWEVKIIALPKSPTHSSDFQQGIRFYIFEYNFRHTTYI